MESQGIEGHWETIQQPCKRQDCPHIRSLASLPALLASLALNKRWFLVEVGSLGALIFLFCRKPGQWCCTGFLLAGPEGSSKLFFLHHLIQINFHFISLGPCQEVKREKGRNLSGFQLCEGTETAPQLLNLSSQAVPALSIWAWYQQLLDSLNSNTQQCNFPLQD